MPSVVIKDEREKGRMRYWRARLSVGQYERWNNSVMVSIGLKCPEDLPPPVLKRWRSLGILTEITYDEWNHTGCQSSCIRRGQEKCSW